MTPVRDIPWEPGLLEPHRDPATAAQLGLLSEADLPPVFAQSIRSQPASPELDAFERAAPLFAREMVRPPACQVPRLKARARDVQAQLSPREFVSLLALRAVANAPCRIGAVATAD